MAEERWYFWKVISHILSIGLIKRDSVPKESGNNISLFSKTFPINVSSCMGSTWALCSLSRSQFLVSVQMLRDCWQTEKELILPCFLREQSFFFSASSSNSLLLSLTPCWLSYSWPHPFHVFPDHAELLLSASTQDLEGEGGSWGSNFH